MISSVLMAINIEISTCESSASMYALAFIYLIWLSAY